MCFHSDCRQAIVMTFNCSGCVLILAEKVERWTSWTWLDAVAVVNGKTNFTRVNVLLYRRPLAPTNAVCNT